MSNECSYYGCTNERLLFEDSCALHYAGFLTEPPELEASSAVQPPNTESDKPHRPDAHYHKTIHDEFIECLDNGCKYYGSKDPSPNTESDKSIDEILNKLVETYYNPTPQNNPFDKKRAKEALYSLLMDVIGFDDDVNSFINQESDEDLLITLQENARNRLRAEQRQKLNQLFNKEK